MHHDTLSRQGARQKDKHGDQHGVHLDFLEGVFRLVQVLQGKGHLVMQLSQPPVICLHLMTGALRKVLKDS